jgi:hypothetical protein
VDLCNGEVLFPLGMDWILKYCLDGLHLQRVNNLQYFACYGSDMYTIYCFSPPSSGEFCMTLNPMFIFWIMMLITSCSNTCHVRICCNKYFIPTFYTVCYCYTANKRLTLGKASSPSHLQPFFLTVIKLNTQHLVFSNNVLSADAAYNYVMYSY